MNEILIDKYEEAEEAEELFQATIEQAWWDMWKAYCFIFQSSIEYHDFVKMMEKIEE